MEKQEGNSQQKKQSLSNSSHNREDNSQKLEFPHSSYNTEEVIVRKSFFENSKENKIKDDYVPKNEDTVYLANIIGQKIDNLASILCQLFGKQIEIDEKGKMSIKKDGKKEKKDSINISTNNS